MSTVTSGDAGAWLISPSKISDKLPFLLIFMIPIPLAVALFFAPESPYYLARKGRLEEAAAAMDRLHRPHPSVDSRELVEQIAETHRIETEMKTGGKWQSCFQGVNLRRTEIAVISWTSPGLVGFVVRASLPTAPLSARADECLVNRLQFQFCSGRFLLLTSPISSLTVTNYSRYVLLHSCGISA